MKTIHKILDVCVEKDLDFNYNNIGLVIFDHKNETKTVGYVSNRSQNFDEDLEKLLDKLEEME